MVTLSTILAMVQSRASTLPVPHFIYQLVLSLPENLKFREVGLIQPTDTSGSGNGLITPLNFNTSAEPRAEKLQH